MVDLSTTDIARIWRRVYGGTRADASYFEFAAEVIAADRALNAPGQPVAWAHKEDLSRVITAAEKAKALTQRRAAGLAEWYTVPLYTPAAPVAPAEPAPPGWQLVPVEPTQEMQRAAVVYANGNAVYKNVAAEVLRIEESIYAEVWSAMLDAAPHPATAGSGQGAEV